MDLLLMAIDAQCYLRTLLFKSIWTIVIAEATPVDDIKTPLIPTETLQSIDAQLQEMSKRQPLQRQRRYSQLDLVKARYAEIEALVDRGFAIDEIAKCFAAANEP